MPSDLGNGPADPTPVVLSRSSWMWDLGWPGTAATLSMGGILLVYVVGEIAELASTQQGGRAEATITSFRTTYSRGGAPSYFPIFRFKTTDGRVFEVVSRAGSGWQWVSVGERVAVAYPKAHPAEAEMLGWGMYMKLILLIVLMLPPLVVGVASMASRIRCDSAR